MDKPRSFSDTSKRVSRLDHKIRVSDHRLMRGSVRRNMSDQPAAQQKLSLPARLLKYFDVDIPDAYVTLPTQKSKHTAHRWLIEIRGLNGAAAPLRIEVAGDVVLGVKRGSGDAPDIDLLPYDGMLKGVSRNHAVIRPSKSRLFLIDLDSRNGTRVNTMAISSSTAKELKDQDVVSLGALSFSVAILKAP